MVHKACPGCARALVEIDRLKQRIVDLQFDLRATQTDALLSQIQARLPGLTATRAKYIARLYLAGGKVVTREVLLRENICQEITPQTVDVIICTARKVLRAYFGDAPIITASVGRGYFLTPHGLACIKELLEHDAAPRG